MRKRTFSVLLFDEIEKSHVRILDKFLQIFEDGHLTDGKGETVYFSETIIIFTLRQKVDRRRRSVLPPQLLPTVLEAPEFIEALDRCDKLSHVIYWHVQPASRYRQEQLGGHSPFVFEDSFTISILCYDHLAQFDIAVQLLSLHGWYFGEPIDLSFLPASRHRSQGGLRRRLRGGACGAGMRYRGLRRDASWIGGKATGYGGSLGVLDGQSAFFTCWTIAARRPSS